MDIKPPNFVFVRGELKVIDLGCAELVAAGCGHVLSTASKGTEGYMAPECFTLTQDRRFVYSVRCSGADMRRVVNSVSTMCRTDSYSLCILLIFLVSRLVATSEIVVAVKAFLEQTKKTCLHENQFQRPSATELLCAIR